MLSKNVARPLRKVPSAVVLVIALTLAALGGYTAFNIWNITNASAESPQKSTAGLGAFSGDQKTAIQEIIREYFLANPELLLEVQAELEKNMAKAEEERFKKSIAENAQFLYRRTDAPSGGNDDGDVTVVEFFDYNCGYCKRSYSTLASLIEKDPKVRVVLMEYPILSKGSEEAGPRCARRTQARQVLGNARCPITTSRPRRRSRSSQNCKKNWARH